MKKTKVTKILRKQSRKLEALLAKFDIGKHGGEAMAYGPTGTEVGSDDQPATSIVRYRAVDRKGRIYLHEGVIGATFKLVEQPQGALLLIPTDEVPLNEYWVVLPKNARAFEEARQGMDQDRDTKSTETDAPAYEADDGPLTARQIREIEKIAAKHMPKGRVVSKSSLFQKSKPGKRSRADKDGQA